jgi:hypothetical protein
MFFIPKRPSTKKMHYERKKINCIEDTEDKGTTNFFVH